MKWTVAMATFAGALALATPAAASPSARLVYLRNPGTESCPDETAVRGAVAARLGYDPFFPNASETMFIEISREEAGYHARVKLVAADNNVRGTREIAQAGDECTGIIDTLALTMSIAIDPDSLTRPPPEEPKKEEPPPPPPPPPKPELIEAPPLPHEAPVPPTRTRPPIDLWLAPVVWIASGPPTAFGGELGARIRWERVSAGLSLRGDVPASRTLDAVKVTLGFVGASAAVCGHASIFAACAESTLGVLTASSNAVAKRSDTSARWLAGASAGVEIPATESLLVLGRVIGNESLGSQTVFLNRTNVYDLPHLSVGFELGAAIRF
jgi:hypothetical protein